ncbi:MAG: PQQ-dependent sugar dehydrogenase [Bdellovibrionales bacterium]
MKYLLIFLFPIFSWGQRLEKLASDLEIPWGLVFLDSDQILLTERTGQIKVFNIKTRTAQAVQNGRIQVVAYGQGGLLDIALHPDFKSTGQIFFTYSKGMADEKSTTALATAQLLQKKGQWILSEMRDLFVAEPALSRSYLHYGSRIVVTKSEIWMTVGERNERKHAQDLSNHLGKVLRLSHEGEALPDNPFFGKTGIKPEIWSYGHRNPQGLLKHPATGEIWEHEHGPRGGDEINLIKKGANYGWPLVTFGKEYSGGTISDSPYREGIEAPRYQYTPSIAPCGFAFYEGTKIPSFQNSFLLGALALTHLSRVTLGKNSSLQQDTRFFDEESPRIREVEVGPDQLVYFSTDAGEIWRVRP